MEREDGLQDFGDVSSRKEEPDEDHLVSTGQTSFGYDLDGFLLYRDDEGAKTRYDYASRGELLSVSLADGRLIEYVYDPLGRRIAKKIDGAFTQKYLWQGLTRLLAVYDANERFQLRFEYAGGRLPVAMTGENGARSHLFYDPVGSLRLVVDGQGNVAKEIQYDAFGSVLSDSNPGLHIPLGFAGGLHDPDTGLVRFGFRDYDPATGRWTAKDPIGFAGGDTDLYGYCLNDPVNWIDPVGLKGGLIIPIRNFIKANVAGADLIVLILEKGSAIPMSSFRILTFDLLNPKAAGVVDEEYLIYQWDNKNGNNDENLIDRHPFIFDKTIESINKDYNQYKPCL